MWVGCFPLCSMSVLPIGGGKCTFLQGETGARELAIDCGGVTEDTGLARGRCEKALDKKNRKLGLLWNDLPPEPFHFSHVTSLSVPPNRELQNTSLLVIGNCVCTPMFTGIRCSVHYMEASSLLSTHYIVLFFVFLLLFIISSYRLCALLVKMGEKFERRG